MTKEERQKYNKAYGEANKDKIKGYYQASKDKIKEYNEANKDKRKEYQKEYYEANKDKRKKYREANKVKAREYREANKDKRKKYHNEYSKKRRVTDQLFKMMCYIRSIITKSMRRNGYKKTSRTAEILGCSFEVFKVHIEEQFPRDMTWDNAGLWHYDHVKPLASATSEEELLRLNHYTNFQPLWEKDNLEKSDNPDWVKCPIKYAK